MEEEQRPTVTSQENITVVEKFDGSVKLRLLDAALWHSFHQEGTEMIITKAGRSEIFTYSEYSRFLVSSVRNFDCPWCAFTNVK